MRIISSRATTVYDRKFIYNTFQSAHLQILTHNLELMILILLEHLEVIYCAKDLIDELQNKTRMSIE